MPRRCIGDMKCRIFQTWVLDGSKWATSPLFHFLIWVNKAIALIVLQAELTSQMVWTCGKDRNPEHAACRQSLTDWANVQQFITTCTLVTCQWWNAVASRSNRSENPSQEKGRNCSHWLCIFKIPNSLINQTQSFKFFMFQQFIHWILLSAIKWTGLSEECSELSDKIMSSCTSLYTQTVRK